MQHQHKVVFSWTVAGKSCPASSSWNGRTRGTGVQEDRLYKNIAPTEAGTES